MGTLIEKNNGYLAVNSIAATLVQVKTLTLASQMNPTQNAQVIQFLYEAGQLSNDRHPLDLSSAEFSGIDLSSPKIHFI